MRTITATQLVTTQLITTTQLASEETKAKKAKNKTNKLDAMMDVSVWQLASLFDFNN